VTYQGHLHMGCYEFSLGCVFARSGEEAERVASANGMWNKRPDGSWGNEASQAHAQLSRDQIAAYRALARQHNEAARRALGGPEGGAR
jgi:hypothetical protein